MNNLCSIHHSRFSNLFEITGNGNRAIFLEKCIFWWQISRYTLDDGKIWFTRSIEDMAKAIYVSARTINRYLNDFEKNGLIERTCRLGWSKQTNSSIKRLYIRITEKLLAILVAPVNPRELPLKESSKPPRLDLDISLPAADFSFDNVVIGNDKIAPPLYKEEDSNLLNNNTVSEPPLVNNLNVTPKARLNPGFSELPLSTTPPQLAIEQLIGERIDSQLKNYIKGTLKNLQIQHKIRFSNPDQIFAEMIFSILNPENQLKGIENLHHRVNIIAKLMREKKWMTPKGFYNHWDIGALFKKRQQDKEASYAYAKQQEMQSRLSLTSKGEIVFKIPEPILYPQKSSVEHARQKDIREKQKRLQELYQAIAGEQSYLVQMKKYYGHDEHAVVNTIIRKLEQYQQEKAMVKRALSQLNAA